MLLNPSMPHFNHLPHNLNIIITMPVNDESNGLVVKLIVCLIAAASATVVITIYHCITARFMEWHGRQITLPPPQIHREMSLDSSVAELLPAHKYRKGVGLVGVDDGTCAICLSEFEEGEELRTLPECVHSFHVVCIDMWLYSHSNCPMCRTFVGAAELSAPTLMHLLEPGVARA